MKEQERISSAHVEEEKRVGLRMEIRRNKLYILRRVCVRLGDIEEEILKNNKLYFTCLPTREKLRKFLASAINKY